MLVTTALLVAPLVVIVAVDELRRWFKERNR
ncbi:MAG: hypothetical protein ACI9KE_001740 [Polyangiales bacterium]|jgi:hypothetical protein